MTQDNAAGATQNPLTRFNASPDAEAVDALLACCAVPGWARAVADSRPYESVDHLQARGDEHFGRLTWAEIETAVAAHPRIGERSESDWSRQEQAGTDGASIDTRSALREGNLAYEKRFDRTFLICATGLSAEQMLRSLETRLANDDDTERGVVREELRKITLLRLAKLAEGTR